MTKTSADNQHFTKIADLLELPYKLRRPKLRVVKSEQIAKRSQTTKLAA